MADPLSETIERRKGAAKGDRKKKRKREKAEAESEDEGRIEKRLKKEKKERKKDMKKQKKRRKSDIEIQEEVEEEAAVESDAGAKAQIEDEEEKETKTSTPSIEERPQPKKKEKKKRKSETGPMSTEAPEPAPPPKHLAILEKLRKVKEKVSSASTSATGKYNTFEVQSSGRPLKSSPLNNSSFSKSSADATTEDTEARVNNEVKEQLPAPAGLEPIPQPPLTKATIPHIPLSSALPPWLANPITVNPSKTQPFSEITCISERLHSRLSALSMTSAFAVQSIVIPLLLSPDSGDMCISAATGSGKTLAYVLPIVQALSTRVVTRLRAVIVVPTRELVSQVHAVARSLSTGTGLKIGTAVGSKALSLEQAQLVDEDGNGGSKIDVLVCTPGRLVEHIKTTKGFTLKFLKWLVIDEADRLLAQSFQEWVSTLIGEIERVDASAQEEKLRACLAGTEGGSTVPFCNSFAYKNGCPSLLKRSEAGQKRSLCMGERNGTVPTKQALSSILEDLGIRRKPPGSRVRKIVLSATMTRDAGKLSDLKLRKPSMIAVESESLPIPDDNTKADREEQNIPDETFTLPPTLQELLLPIPDTSLKPLHLLTYLQTLPPPTPQTIIFTSSNSTAIRLSTLLSTFSSHPTAPSPAASWITKCITSETPRKQRARHIRAFTKGEAGILVCSDLVARGLDIENVAVVINYEVPASVRGYVHRVGRTARAGRKGTAVSLVEEKEAGWFRAKIGGRGVVRSGGAIEKGQLEVPAEGTGWRGVYEEVLFG